MSVWDYVMPHRLLINKSLRKEAEGLRARVDAYQIEYDRRVEECQEELKKVEEERQEKILQFRNSLIEELQEEQSFLESVAQDITSYADEYFHRNCTECRFIPGFRLFIGPKAHVCAHSAFSLNSAAPPGKDQPGLCDFPAPGISLPVFEDVQVPSFLIPGAAPGGTSVPPAVLILLLSCNGKPHFFSQFPQSPFSDSSCSLIDLHCLAM